MQTLFETTPSPIKQYSINLMWINDKKSESQQYISNEATDEAVIQRLLRPAVEWAKANPEAKINLWFDSEYTTDIAIQNTRRLLSQLIESNHLDNINFRDIRSIAMVKQNIDAFSDKIPIYFRVDLLKCIIVVEAIERESQDAAIFADLEVGDAREQRMSKDELFPSYRQKYGCCMNMNGSRIENQFLQLYNNKVMLEAMKVAVINASLKRIEYALTFAPKRLENYQQSVYQSLLWDLMDYYRAIRDRKPILVLAEPSNYENVEPFDLEKHGYAAFGFNCASSSVKEDSHFRIERSHSIPAINVFIGRGGSRHSCYPFIDRAPADGKAYCVTLMELDPQYAPPHHLEMHAEEQQRNKC